MTWGDQLIAVVLWVVGLAAATMFLLLVWSQYFGPRAEPEPTGRSVYDCSNPVLACPYDDIEPVEREPFFP